MKGKTTGPKRASNLRRYVHTIINADDLGRSQRISPCVSVAMPTRNPMIRIMGAVLFSTLMVSEPALAQTWLEEVLAARKAPQAQEREVGSDADMLAEIHYDLRGMMDEAQPPGEGVAATGPRARSAQRARRFQALVDNVAGLHRLSIAFQSFRFAALEQRWTQRDIRERSKSLEDVSRDLFRSMTDVAPETFEYEREQFAARPLEEQLTMIGTLAAHVRGQIVQTLQTGVIDVTRQKSIVSRMNILLDLGRYLQIAR